MRLMKNLDWIAREHGLRLFMVGWRRASFAFLDEVHDRDGRHYRLLHVTCACGGKALSFCWATPWEFIGLSEGILPGEADGGLASDGLVLSTSSTGDLATARLSLIEAIELARAWTSAYSRFLYAKRHLSSTGTTTTEAASAGVRNGNGHHTPRACSCIRLPALPVSLERGRVAREWGR